MATQSQAPTQACQACQGSGVVNVGGQAQVCPVCDGTGQSYVPGLFYVYPATTTLTALGTGSITISILNAPFKWLFATKVNTGSFTIGIADSRNGRQFFSATGGVNNNQINADLAFGDAHNPFPILNPYIFPQNGAIQIAVTDISNASNTIWLGFVGLELIPAQTQGS